MKDRRILIVEDDAEQFNLIKEELDYAFEGTRIDTIRTESEFYDRLDKIISSPPDLILMDMMLRWTFPAPPEDMPLMPDEVERDGYYRAGIRCVQKLLEKKPQQEIPILVFTVLNQEDLEADLKLIEGNEFIHITSLPKTSPIQKLLHEISRIAPAFQ